MSLSFYIRNCILGETYDVSYNGYGSFHYKNCKFIRVTPKGFNFLNPETNCCILKHHLYSKDFARKEMPSIEFLQYRKIRLWLRDEIIIKNSKKVTQL